MLMRGMPPEDHYSNSPKARAECGFYLSPELGGTVGSGLKHRKIVLSTKCTFG